VLFDEIEKAHPEVLNILLQLLDDGRLTDGKGRTVDFKNSVIIMTSNVGSHFIAEAASRTALAAGLSSSESFELSEGIKREVMEALRAHFRPEFLNRIDEIIVFHALSRAQMRHVIDIQLRGLMRRLEDRKIHVELTDKAKDLLIEEGYDPTYGARPLKRTIQRRVLDPLAMRVLQGEFTEGDAVRIDAGGGALTFTKAAAPVTA
jgi:ATP-dependent Clp protease ATP-binding subunit ClpB